MNNATATAPDGPLDALLDSPIAGLSPWIIFSVLVGPGRFELALALALAVTAMLVIAGRIRRRVSSLTILEASGIVFFGALAAVTAAASRGTHEWLETYAGEISNLAVVLIALGSMAVRAPFTVQYAREHVGRELWHSRDFLRTNYVITAVWGLAFLVAAFAGGLGDLVLHNVNNLWTGWIVQIAAIVAAASFTAWYPQLVQSRMGTGRPRPPVRSLLIPLAVLLIVVGIVVLLFDAAASWFAVGLIMAGIVLARAIRKDVELTNRGGRHLT
jgi:hypothetical protein